MPRRSRHEHRSGHSLRARRPNTGLTQMPSASITFGQWLRQHRKVLDFTQEGLAERIACSYIAIHKIEAGERRPSRQVAYLLADLFDVPAEEREAFIAFARGLSANGDHAQQFLPNAAS